MPSSRDASFVSEAEEIVQNDWKVVLLIGAILLAFYFIVSSILASSSKEIKDALNKKSQKVNKD